MGRGTLRRWLMVATVSARRNAAMAHDVRSVNPLVMRDSIT